MRLKTLKVPSSIHDRGNIARIPGCVAPVRQFAAFLPESWLWEISVETCALQGLRSSQRVSTRFCLSRIMASSRTASLSGREQAKEKFQSMGKRRAKAPEEGEVRKIDVRASDAQGCPLICPDKRGGIFDFSQDSLETIISKIFALT